MPGCVFLMVCIHTLGFCGQDQDQTQPPKDDQNVVQEVSEKMIMKNPQDYIGKQIWQKPPFKYDIVITLKRIRVED